MLQQVHRQVNTFDVPYSGPTQRAQLANGLTEIIATFVQNHVKNGRYFVSSLRLAVVVLGELTERYGVIVRLLAAQHGRGRRRRVGYLKVCRVRLKA